MGAVYRARDSKLDRDVAIKVLPDSFANDPDRLMRFEREAKTLASLNHPNIAGIYGIEERALVMELVEGEDLSARIARGPIPLAEALPIARQIAEALEAAHEQGIVHRDLKPANIKLREDGVVKVLDFGLAKALDQDLRNSGVQDLVNSPTRTSPAMTQAGIILGTAAYMSPEQARGKRVDRRTDVWAVGCVLYEMLAGRRVFDGEDATEMISAVLRTEPDWSALPPGVPPHVRAVVARCLVKDRKDRIPDVSVVRFALDGSLAGAAVASPPAITARSAWQRAGLVAAAAVAGAAAFAVVAGPSGWGRMPEAAVSRLSIEGTGGVSEIAISRDGTRALLRRGDGLALRSLSNFDIVPLKIAASEIGNAVFSPDGQSISFTAGPVLKRTTTAGGATVDLATLPDEATGCEWTGDDIYCAVGAKGVVRVAAAGGALEQVITLRPGEVAATPALVPGGSTLLFTLAPGIGSRGDWTRSSVVAESLSSGNRNVIAATGSDPHYLSTNQIAYVVEGVWFAVGFDPKAGHAVGAPVAVLEGVGRASTGGLLQPRAKIDISATGTLVYARGPVTVTGGGRQVIATDRGGHERVLPLEPREYESPRISPDGRQLAISTDTAREAAVWIYDLSGAQALRRLTFTGRNRLPVWSPDGRRLAFQSDRAGDTAIFVQPADGSRDAERWTTAPAGTVHVPESWSRDGRYLAFSSMSENGAELWLRSISTGDAARFADVQSNAPLNAAFSPDGRWVAYSQRLGTSRTTVFVQPVPVTGAKYQIASDAAHHPFWSPDGKELFYWGIGGGRLMATSMPASGPAALGPAARVPGDHPSNMNALGPRNYDITPDGREFVLTRSAASEAAGDTGSLDLVLNWLAEMKRGPRP